jgi:hypothetical protein
MYTTSDENGILNNYAVEPKISYAEYPTVYDQKRYVKQAAIATLLVSVIVFLSFVVS